MFSPSNSATTTWHLAEASGDPHGSHYYEAARLGEHHLGLGHRDGHVATHLCGEWVRWCSPPCSPKARKGVQSQSLQVLPPSTHTVCGCKPVSLVESYHNLGRLWLLLPLPTSMTPHLWAPSIVCPPLGLPVPRSCIAPTSTYSEALAFSQTPQTRDERSQPFCLSPEQDILQWTPAWQPPPPEWRPRSGRSVLAIHT